MSENSDMELILLYSYQKLENNQLIAIAGIEPALASDGGVKMKKKWIGGRRGGGGAPLSVCPVNGRRSL